MENDGEIRDGPEEGLDGVITVLRSDVTSHGGQAAQHNRKGSIF